MKYQTNTTITLHVKEACNDDCTTKAPQFTMLKYWCRNQTELRIFKKEGQKLIQCSLGSERSFF